MGALIAGIGFIAAPGLLVDEIPGARLTPLHRTQERWDFFGSG